ncbi:adaptin region, partial [Teladorsagia circumcincta]
VDQFCCTVEVVQMKFSTSNVAQLLLQDGCKGFISSALLLWDGGGRVENREASYRAVDSAPSEANARYIASCIEEIKMELRQDSTYIKANAIEKLAYTCFQNPERFAKWINNGALQMLGYDISWAAFNVIEVMASTKYTEKRIGSNMYDSGVALGGLSCFVTPDLARDLASDIVNLLSSSRPYTRKRAVLLLYKIFLKYPEALRPTFQRLKDKLEDPDPVLISISAGGDHAASIQLCVQKLGVLIEDSDQNLKYLGLLAMGKILQTHPKAVQAHKDIVLRCLDDKDESIRIRSLDLLYGMVSKKNIMEIVKKLMEHVESAEGSHYRSKMSPCVWNPFDISLYPKWLYW